MLGISLIRMLSKIATPIRWQLLYYDWSIITEWYCRAQLSLPICVSVNPPVSLSVRPPHFTLPILRQLAATRLIAYDQNIYQTDIVRTVSVSMTNVLNHLKENWFGIKNISTLTVYVVAVSNSIRKLINVPIELHNFKNVNKSLCMI